MCTGIRALVCTGIRAQEYVHLCVTSSPLKVYISLGAFQNSDPCRGQSNLVLFVFVLKRGGRGRREGKEGEGGEGRGVSVVTKHSEDGGDRD